VSYSSFVVWDRLQSVEYLVSTPNGTLSIITSTYIYCRVLSLQLSIFQTAQLFYTRNTITIFRTYFILSSKDKMSLNLNSIRAVTHASIMGRTPTLFMGLSKLSHGIPFPATRRCFSAFGRKAAPKEENTAQKVRAPRMRPRYRPEQISTRQLVYQKPKTSAVTAYRAGQSGWSGLFDEPRVWEQIRLGFWSSCLYYLLNRLSDRFVKPIERSEAKHWLIMENLVQRTNRRQKQVVNLVSFQSEMLYCWC
jgi:hypothetical protein